MELLLLIGGAGKKILPVTMFDKVSRMASALADDYL